MRARQTLTPGSAELLNEAVRLLVAALDLIDRAGAPGDIGASVDLARARICEILEPGPTRQEPDAAH